MCQYDLIPRSRSLWLWHPLSFRLNFAQFLTVWNEDTKAKTLLYPQIVKQRWWQSNNLTELLPYHQNNLKLIWIPGHRFYAENKKTDDLASGTFNTHFIEPAWAILRLVSCTRQMWSNDMVKYWMTKSLRKHKWSKTCAEYSCQNTLLRCWVMIS